MDKIQEEIIGEFSVFDDWLDKYDYLIGLSDSLPAIAAEHRTEQYLIDGCQSRVWVAPTSRPRARTACCRWSNRCGSMRSRSQAKAKNNRQP